ncbi:MAG: hypothetical protein AAB354_15685, partial [candidate division KSB1 bacterium]
GISQTDADVISLAMQDGGIVLSEDGLLRHSALKLGLAAFSLSSLLLWFYQGGIFTKDECRNRLHRLHERDFLSKAEYRRLLQEL